MFFRSLFNSSRETYLSWRKENRDMSSAKFLHVVLGPSLKSFIYIYIYIYILKTKEGQELDLVEHWFLSPPKKNSDY